MSIEAVTLLLFGGMLVLLLLGIQVVYAIGAISIVTLVLVDGVDGLYFVATTTYREITDVSLLTIPLFVLMGNFLTHSGVAEKLFQALHCWLHRVRGSLAIVAVGVCVALAMCGGFGPGILTMGLIAVPAMLKQGYDRSLALGSVMAGGVLGEIIPPSIIMIIFAYISRLSVGKLFFAGVVPGLLTAALYVVYILVRAYRTKNVAREEEESYTWRHRLSSLKHVALPALLVVGVLGSIITGIATPTEAAAVGAVGAMVVCAIHRRLSTQVLRDSCRETLKISGMALWILVVATLFGVVYTSAGAQDMVMEVVEQVQLNRWVILAVMQVILLVFGAFMDDYAVVTICAPIFVPIAQSLGFDPIWFAILFILNMQVAYLTPPFGWALILMKGIAPPQVRTRDVWWSVPPFIAIQVLVLILTMVFPEIALWLPKIAF